MKRLTNILNGILGAGNNRRSGIPTPRISDARVWEVRQKFDTQRQPAIRKANKR